MPNRSIKKPTNRPPLSQSDTDRIVEAVSKPRRVGNPAFSPDAYGMTEPGDNARFVRLAMASWNLPPIDISDPKQVEQRINEYFRFCADNDRKPQMVGMANWLGVSRDTLQSWKRGEYRKETHSAIIQKAVSALEELWAEYMLNGKVNPASGIFIAKNWYNYSDTQQIVVTPNNPLDQADGDEARKKYIQALPEIASDIDDGK